MKIIPNKKYKGLFENKTRYFLLCGGRGAGRSYAGSQKAILDTVTLPYSRIAVMRYILGDVRSSIWQEIKDRIEDNNLPPVSADQMMHYSYGSNIIDGKGFRQSSSQNKAKLKSLAGYNTIIIEEANEVLEEDFDNLDVSIRTQKAPNQIILMFNMPNKDHWIVKRWFNLIESEADGFYVPIPKDRKDTTYLVYNYEININNLTNSSIDLMEQYKETNPEYYYTMIKGYVSDGLKGRVFKDWKPITSSEFVSLPYPSRYGLDFGFSSDPTAIVEVKEHNDNIWVREVLYETGLTNQDIGEKIKTLDITGEIIADSAEPKSIEEIRRMGINIKPAEKGVDSIRAGIDKIRSKKVCYTENSQNIVKEIQNYVYQLDENKNPTNKPIDAYNHCLDALRYCIYTKQTNFIIV